MFIRGSADMSCGALINPMAGRRPKLAPPRAQNATVFKSKTVFPACYMLLRAISLSGQMIQLSVCLWLIPKLGVVFTYHLFCRSVFSQNATGEIAGAVIKMAQRQI